MTTPADIVIISDAMFRSTSRGEVPAPGGVAINGATISAVGAPEEIERYIGPKTVVRRFGADKLLMPALCDAHLHLENTILCECGPVLRFVTSEDECVANVKKWHEDNPDSYWVIGFGWHQANWPGGQVPNKESYPKRCPITRRF